MIRNGRNVRNVVKISALISALILGSGGIGLTAGVAVGGNAVSSNMGTYGCAQKGTGVGLGVGVGGDTMAVLVIAHPA